MALFERYVFGPHVPKALRTSDVKAKAWTRFLAGSMVMNRNALPPVHGLGAGPTIFARFWQNASGLPADGAYWTATTWVCVDFRIGTPAHDQGSDTVDPDARHPGRGPQWHRRDRLRVALLEVWPAGSHGG